MKKFICLTMILLNVWAAFTPAYAASRQPQANQQSYLMIRIDPVTVAPGGNVTAIVMGDIPTGSSLKSIFMYIQYDPAVIQFTSCKPDPSYFCFPAPSGSGIYLFWGSLLKIPITGTVTLGEVGFLALGASGQVSDLTPTKVDAKDDKDKPITGITTIKGMVTITGKDPYFISGKVSDSLGKPVQDITITDDAGHKTITDNYGIYTIPRLPAGKYTIKASAGVSGISFIPEKYEKVEVPPYQRGKDFTMDATYTIGGVVTNDQGKPIAGVTLSDGTGNKAVTDASGNYLFQSVSKGMHTIVAGIAGYAFTPGTRIVNVPPNATGQVFVGVQQAANDVSISGKVVDSQKSPLAGVVLTLSTGQVTTTDGNGNYIMRGVASGVYTLYATQNGYIFIPVSRTVSLPRDSSGQDFTGKK